MPNDPEQLESKSNIPNYLTKDLLNQNNNIKMENNEIYAGKQSIYYENIFHIIYLIKEFNQYIDSISRKTFRIPNHLNNEKYFLIKSKWFEEFKNIYLYNDINDFLKSNDLNKDEKNKKINDLFKKNGK